MIKCVFKVFHLKFMPFLYNGNYIKSNLNIAFHFCGIMLARQGQ